MTTFLVAASTNVTPPTMTPPIMTLYELLVQGGWAMIPIYACSIVGVGVFVQKLIELRQADLRSLGWLAGVIEHVEAGDYASAERVCRSARHPGARVLEAVVYALNVRPSQVEAEAKRVGSQQLQQLERNLALLSFLAQIAPLLGLLGTVVGMVELFMGLQAAGHEQLAVGDLASGIWKALLTTAAGLTVAVPALAAYAFLTSRVDAVRLQFADMVQRVLFRAPETTSMHEQVEP